MDKVILNNYIGERGRAKFTVIKRNNGDYYFRVDSPYFNNSSYIARFYIWADGDGTTHYDLNYKYNATYYTLELAYYLIKSKTHYNFHVYIEKEVNTPIFIDEAVFISI